MVSKARSPAGGGPGPTALALAPSGCDFEELEVVKCDDGLLCPINFTCAVNQSVCVRDACGNALVEREDDEVCDDGNIIDGDGCSGDCRVLERCGDGVLDPG